MRSIVFLILSLLLAGCGLLVDSTPPEVEITSPVGETVLPVTTELRALAVDLDSGVKSLSIFVDDELVGTNSFEPDEQGAYSLETRTLGAQWLATAGEYQVRVVAVNAFGGTGETEKTVTVESDNLDDPDTTAPTVGWNTPSEGDVVSGTVTLSAFAFDDTGVTKVEFHAGQTLLFTDDEAPYGFDWDTADADVGRADGPVTLTATAFDTADRRTEAAVSVTLMNSGVPPTLSIVEPGDGATVGVQFTVTAEVLDVGADFSWVLDSGHALWVRIYDQVGHLVVEDYLTTGGSDADPEPSDDADFLGERTFDLSTFLNEFPLDRFDVIVEGTVAMDGTEVKLSHRNTLNISLETNLPPALLIFAPSQMSSGETVFKDVMTVAGRVTDDSGEVDALEFRMVCDACGTGGVPQNKLLFYLDQPYDLFSTGILPLDGTPGANESDEWMLRVVAIDSRDTSLRNIVGIDVTVDRSLTDFSELDSTSWITPVTAGTASVAPTSATWDFDIPALTNPVKVLINVEHNNEHVEFVRGVYSPGDPAISYSRNFGEDDTGTWQLEMILQDTATGAQITKVSQSVAVSPVE